jgi:predicted transcriptional regulator
LLYRRKRKSKELRDFCNHKLILRSLKDFGLVVCRGGFWELTEKGRAVVEKFLDLLDVVKEKKRATAR